MDLNNSHVVEYLQGAKGWNDYCVEADQWAAIGEVTPTDAAMLLCYHNPNESSFDALSSDETGTTTYETPANAGAESMAYTPKHIRMLARRLADIDKAEHRPRTLRDWHQTARGLGLTYHSWIDGYMEATTPPAPTVADTAPVVAVVALVEPAKAGPKFSMTKAAMVAQHAHEWPTLERDMTDASTNGLAAAKAGARGWYEPDAMEWARANNKLANTSKSASSLTQAMNSMGNLPGRKHTLEG
jgi:hypothetical protein